MTYEQALEQLGLSPDIRLRQMFELGRMVAPAQPLAWAEYNFKEGKFTGLTTDDINSVDSVGNWCQWVPQLQATPPAAQQKANADHAIQCATEALADPEHPAAKAAKEYYGAAPVSAQVLGFDVVLDENLPPNTMKFVQPAPVPLTDGVTVPLAVLEAAEASLGSFCSDHGWTDEDMQNMDNLTAYIARHKAHGITEKGQP